MQRYIANGFDVNAMPFFNCSYQNISSEDYTRIHGKSRPILGFIDIVYGVCIEVIYLPCLAVMTRKENIRMSCFKIMLLLGIIDMGAIAVNSIENGILLIEGAVYCSHPTLIYITGSIGLGFWCSACLICLILVLNRIIDILFPILVKKYFCGHRTTLVLLIPISYGLYFTLFTPPLLFTSRYQAWFFDPFIYPGMSDYYQNYPHTANNLFIVVATCLMYGFFCTAISRQFRKHMESTNRRSHSQIFLQSTIICMANFIAAMVYVYMQFFPAPDLVIVIGHISWQLGHGCPAIIYLCMNTTIRGGVLKFVNCQKKRIVGTRAFVTTTTSHPTHSSSVY